MIVLLGGKVRKHETLGNGWSRFKLDVSKGYRSRTLVSCCVHNRPDISNGIYLIGQGYLFGDSNEEPLSIMLQSAQRTESMDTPWNRICLGGAVDSGPTTDPTGQLYTSIWLRTAHYGHLPQYEPDGAGDPYRYKGTLYNRVRMTFKGTCGRAISAMPIGRQIEVNGYLTRQAFNGKRLLIVMGYTFSDLDRLVRQPPAAHAGEDATGTPLQSPAGRERDKQSRHSDRGRKPKSTAPA